MVFLSTGFMGSRTQPYRRGAERPASPQTRETEGGGGEEWWAGGRGLGGTGAGRGRTRAGPQRKRRNRSRRRRSKGGALGEEVGRGLGAEWGRTEGGATGGGGESRQGLEGRGSPGTGGHPTSRELPALVVLVPTDPLHF